MSTSPASIELKIFPEQFPIFPCRFTLTFFNSQYNLCPACSSFSHLFSCMIAYFYNHYNSKYPISHLTIDFLPCHCEVVSTVAISLQRRDCGAKRRISEFASASPRSFTRNDNFLSPYLTILLI